MSDRAKPNRTVVNIRRVGSIRSIPSMHCTGHWVHSGKLAAVTVCSHKNIYYKYFRVSFFLCFFFLSSSGIFRILKQQFISLPQQKFDKFVPSAEDVPKFWPHLSHTKPKMFLNERVSRLINISKTQNFSSPTH